MRRDCKLILVEGLCGTGKSTLAERRDAKMLERASFVTGLSFKLNIVVSPDQAIYEPGMIDCIDFDLLPEDLPYGQVSAIRGDAAFQYVKKATELAMNKDIHAV